MEMPVGRLFERLDYLRDDCAGNSAGGRRAKSLDP